MIAANPHLGKFAVLLASVLACAALPARAQQYPSQPIKIIVPTPPGGVADIVGRAFAQKLSESGKTAVAENKTGATGTIAADFVAKSPPDGYTVYVGFHATQSILPHLMKLPYDAAKDFIPVSLVAKSSNVLVVHPSVPAQSVKELIDYAKANPKKLTYASQGNGSSGHIVAEQLKQIAGIDVVHVPYRGAAPAVQDLIAGHVSMMFDIQTLAVPQVTAGKVRALAVAAPRRLAESARRPDHGGSGVARTGRRSLVRPARSGRDAASDRRLAQCGGDKGVFLAGDARSPRCSGAHAAARLAGGFFPPHRGGDQALGRRHSCRGNPDGVA